MRQRLLEATVDCLVEHGWSGTSTTLVSQRAGVSRGAQLHHFPTKNDLVARRGRAPQRAAGRGAARGGRGSCPPASGAPARCSRCSPTTSPARCSPPRSSCGSRPAPTRRCTRPSYPSSSGSGREAHRIAVDALGVDEDRPRVRELVQATLDLVRGLGLANTITDDTARRGRILAAWAHTLDAELRHDDMTDLLDQVLGRPRRGGRGPRRAGRAARRRRLAYADPGGRLGHRHPGRAPRLDRRGGGRRRHRQGGVGRGRAARRSPTRRASSTPRRSAGAKASPAEILDALARRPRRAAGGAARLPGRARRCRGSARR